jgi:transposase
MLSQLLTKDVIAIRKWHLDKNRKGTIASLSRELHVSWATIDRYCKKFDQMLAKYPGRELTGKYFPTGVKKRPPTEWYFELLDILPSLLSNSDLTRNSPRAVYARYRETHPDGYTFGGFYRVFLIWRKENNFCEYAHKGVKAITPEQKIVLDTWRRGNDLGKWRRAVVITGSFEGRRLVDLKDQVEVGLFYVRAWIDVFNAKGIAGLLGNPPDRKAPWVAQKTEKRDNLMKILHEHPSLHGLNSAAWTRADLSATYFKVYGKPMSVTSVGFCLNESGFRFKRSKLVLTSPDPDFRAKLDNIKHILSHLGEKERFFSMDEYGPFAIKMKPGRSFTPKTETKTVPQLQKSKGWLICTAALELSENQVTHFYSRAKNSTEMIKLIDLLLLKYADQEKLYLSGDAASWHKSAMLQEYIALINERAQKNNNQTPYIEMAWLPSSAQFLNVIESVFSGMAKSIIHNSNYGSVDECMSAIDRHFQERNAFFTLHPKKAGKMIWGKELVKSVFDETQNCKDPKYTLPVGKWPAKKHKKIKPGPAH